MHVIEFQREFEMRVGMDLEGKVDHFQWAERELADFADQPANWNWDDRLGLLAVAFGIESPIYVFFTLVIGVLLASMLSGLGGLGIATLVTLVSSGIVFLMGYFCEGGLAMKFSGVDVCRNALKQKATRFRCGIRNFVVWSPLVLLLACMVVVIKIAIDEVAAGQAMQGLQVSLDGSTNANVSNAILPPLIAMLPLSLLIFVGFFWALIKPARALPDLVAGTELVRK